MLQYLANEPVDKCILNYPLPSGNDSQMEINIEGNIPVYNYDLEAEDGKSISSYYQPLKIRMSRLSVVVYGKDMGSLSNKEFSPDDNERFKSIIMIENDGSRKSFIFTGASGGEMGKKAKKDNPGCDYFVLSQLFCQLDFHIDDNGRLHGEQSVTGFSPEEYKGISLVTGNGETTY
ncbi:MAG: hypothetical protein K1W24_02950 [Lachnospiraceae bacterium]